MTVTRQRSNTRETCSRCEAIGLPALGILRMEPHMVMEHEGEAHRCCRDCWERMLEEMEQEDAANA